ncbi:Uncharacterized mitochondrial protein AtMg00310 [Linum grandiflorum]
MLNSFWWGSRREGGGGIPWMSWIRLYVRKEFGGMVFWDLQHFNLAMVFKAKYFPRGDFLSTRLGNRPSYVWRSIHAAQMVVREGCRWRLRDGRSVKVFSEPWLREEQNCYLDTVPSLQLNDLTVNDLLIPNLRIWDEHLLNLLFCDRDIQAIRSMPPPMADGEDDVRI